MAAFLNFARPFIALAVACLCMLATSVPLTLGYIPSDAPRSGIGWSGLLFDSDAIGSMAVCLAPVFMGALVGGLIQRSGGRFAGGVASTPVALGAYYVYSHLGDSAGFLAEAVTGAIMVATIPVGAVGGYLGEKFASQHESQFDSKSWRVLGAPVAHWLWLLPTTIVALPFLGILINHISSWLSGAFRLFMAFDGSYEATISAGLHVLFIGGYLLAAHLIARGLWGAYLIAAQLHGELVGVRAAAKSGCLLPFVGWGLLVLLELGHKLMYSIT